jgi:hypothetical protein
MAVLFESLALAFITLGNLPGLAPKRNEPPTFFPLTLFTSTRYINPACHLRNHRLL